MSAKKTLANVVKTAKPDLAPHVNVQARAGTGKTTTLIEGLKILKGIGSALTPSPQQQAVWDAIAQSRDAKTVAFVAFNKSIATELQSRVPAGCEAMTMHSMGYKAVQAHFGWLQPNTYVVGDIVAELLGVNPKDVRGNPRLQEITKATERLVSLVKMNLAETDDETLDALAAHYDVELNGSRAKVFELVPQVIERCKQPKGRIDFDDMIWLPVIHDLPVFRYDLLLVDESQDLNRCQQALAKKAGRRIIFVGDDRQAIYGFAGADSESMDRLTRELGETPEGCVTIPLTVTRRCGKAIVREAQKIVPDFEAFETNPEGIISEAAFKGEDLSKTYAGRVQDGDMILCRVNAPLVSQCFRFLRAGRKANIQGRDVGQGLISTIKKSKATTIVDLISWLSEWSHKEQQKEQAKRNPSDQRMIAIQDRVDCITCFTEGAETVADVVTKIEQVFTDAREGNFIRLSSIHKAKGLEARRVFLLQLKGACVPHPMARSAVQKEQEQNLLYVAVTRAIEELVYVTDK